MSVITVQKVTELSTALSALDNDIEDMMARLKGYDNPEPDLITALRPLKAEVAAFVEQCAALYITIEELIGER